MVFIRIGGSMRATKNDYFKEIIKLISEMEAKALDNKMANENNQSSVYYRAYYDAVSDVGLRVRLIAERFSKNYPSANIGW